MANGAGGADEVIKNLRAWSDKREKKIIALARNWAGQLEKRAKEKAPWHDITSNARNGLLGSVQVKIGLRRQVAIKLGHSVDYGIFLELANDGKYAILQPTLNAAVSDIYRAYEKLWTDPTK